jgi:hypothetical protein
MMTIHVCVVGLDRASEMINVTSTAAIDDELKPAHPSLTEQPRTCSTSAAGAPS